MTACELSACPDRPRAVWRNRKPCGRHDVFKHTCKGRTRTAIKRFMARLRWQALQEDLC